jgi:glycosyltransferase involved in cell wall biosynthesis
MSKPGVSVVICTYNGASRLPETIRHIAAQQVPEYIPWEFIIIDNASTDNTASVAQHEWSKYIGTQSFSIIEEPQSGLSYARARGFASAQYDYILLCDDDNWLDPHYVTTVYEVMTANIHIGALGGYGSLVFEEEPPSWIRSFSIYAAGRQAQKSGPVIRCTVYGAGCVIRKSAYDILLKSGYRSLLTDRLRKELSSGGDYELCLALAIAGFSIWYDERLTFSHFITRDRITIEYYRKYLKESAKCLEVLHPYKVICDWKFQNVKIFRYRMVKSLLYLLRTYIRFKLIIPFLKKDNNRYTLVSLQAYSARIMISVYIRNWNKILANYNHGKALQQKFTKSPGWKTLQANIASLFPL